MSQITLTVPVGPLIGDPARGGEVAAAPGFGIRANGAAYYDPDGAAGGEAAWLRLSPSGKLKLEQHAPAPTFGLVEGDARPVELAAHITGPITEKPGVTVTLLAFRAPEGRAGRAVELPGQHVPPVVPPTMLHPQARDGQPVALAAPRTPKLRRGRPVKVGKHRTLALHHGRPLDLPEHQTLAILPDTRVRTQ